MFVSKKIISFLLGTTLFFQSGSIYSAYSAFADDGGVVVPRRANSKKLPSKSKSKKGIEKNEKNTAENVVKVGAVGAVASFGLYELWHRFFRNDVTRPARHPEIPSITSLLDLYSSSNTALIEKTANFTRFLEMCRGKVNNQEHIAVAELESICRAVTPLLQREPSVVDIRGRTMIVGDIHGNFAAAEHCCHEFFSELERTGGNTSIVFLGDYVDRGQNSVECMTLIFMLKIMFPDKVFLLRGNHEDPGTNFRYGFCGECVDKYGGDGSPYVSSIHNMFNDVFVHLPVAAVIDNRTFCVHGGIPAGDRSGGHVSPKTLAEIRSVSKVGIVENSFTSSIDDSSIDDNRFIIVNLLWNDPRDADAQFSEGYNRNVRYAYLFGKQALDEFLETNGLERVVRAHEFAEQGYEELFEGRCVTVFSSPNYRGEGSNRGAIMIVDGTNEPEYRQFG